MCCFGGISLCERVVFCSLDVRVSSGIDALLWLLEIDVEGVSSSMSSPEKEKEKDILESCKLKNERADPIVAKTILWLGQGVERESGSSLHRLGTKRDHCRIYWLHSIFYSRDITTHRQYEKFDACGKVPSDIGCQIDHILCPKKFCLINAQCRAPTRNTP